MSNLVLEPQTELETAFGDISDSYAAMGTLQKPAVWMRFYNGTDEPMQFSLDGENSFVTVDAGEAVAIHVQTNKGTENRLTLRKGTVVYVQQHTGAASSGFVTFSYTGIEK